MRLLIAVLGLFSPLAAMADIVVPARTIRAKQIIQVADLARKDQQVPGAVTSVDALVGQEARVALYPGRPIQEGDVGPAAIVDRNDLVVLVFDRRPLSIKAEGRALGRGGVGDRIRVMNLSSRSTVTGLIRADGQIEVK